MCIVQEVVNPIAICTCIRNFLVYYLIKRMTSLAIDLAHYSRKMILICRSFGATT